MVEELKNAREVQRTVEETRITRVFIVDATQHNAVFGVLIPGGIDIGESYPGDSDYRIISISTESIPAGGPQYTKATVIYSDKAEEITEPDSGPIWSYSVDTESATVLVDLNGAYIGADGEGTERIFPRPTAQCRIYLDEPDASFNDYLSLVAKTNNALFNGSAAGLYLYAGFDARRYRSAPGHDKWEIVHRFWYRSNDWRHRWWYYRKIIKATLGQTREIREPISGTQFAQLYDSGNFGLLDI